MIFLNSAGKRLIFGPFELDTRERRLARDGVPVAVQPKVFDFIALLAENAGRLMTRAELMSELWPGVVVTEAAVSRCVRQARATLDDCASQPEFIETVPKAGFRFIAEVRRAGATPRHTTLSSRIVSGGLLVLVVGAATFWSISHQPSPEPMEEMLPDVAAINSEREYRLGQDALELRSRESIKLAKDHFERALERNPRHAPAIAGLANAMFLLERFSITPDTARQIRNLAERALEIDPGLAGGQRVLGLLAYNVDDDPAEAERRLRRAIELDAGDIESYVTLSTVVQDQGRLKEAIDLKRTGLAQRPTHVVLTGNLALSFVQAGRYEEAMELIQSMGEMRGAGPGMVYPHSQVLQVSGRQAEDVMVLLGAVEQQWLYPYNLPELVERLVRMGRKDLAHALLDASLYWCDETGPLPQLFALALWTMDPGGNRLATMVATQDGIAPAAWITRWSGLVAAHRGQWSSTVELLRSLYPSAQSVRMRRGSILSSAIDAHYLALALQRTGRESEALIYIDHVARVVSQLRDAGFTGGYNLTLVEARGLALKGMAAEAIQRLDTALDAGWSGHELDSPFWDGLRSRPEFSGLRRKATANLARWQAQLDAAHIEERVSGVVAQLRKSADPECVSGMATQASTVAAG